MTIEELNIVIKANSSQLQSQISKVQNQVNGMAANTQKASNTMSAAFGKITKAVTAVVSAAALVSFGKQAIDLASDLQEVQNVVDTAFGSMSSQVDAWAKTTVSRFGVSELAAKQAASTYMAMTKGMGMVGQQAADMAMLAAERTGDIASFYNMTQQEADTLMKSVWTGETEALKRIGVVMTQTNLNAFAMAKGIGKTVDEMTQAEQVQLRYMYVMEQTSLAAGDFSKTSDSWANQTRVLTERWKEFMSVVGQNLVQVLTPVVQFLNRCLESLIAIANQVSRVLETTFGWKVQDSATAGTLAMAQAQAELAEQTTAAAEAAEKATLGFDELNILGSNGAEGSTASGDDFSFDAGESAVEISEIEEPATPVWLDSWSQKFKKAFDVTDVVNKAKQKLPEIKTTIQNVFGPAAETVKTSFGTILENVKGTVQNAAVFGGEFIRQYAAGVEQYAPELEQGLASLFNGTATLWGSVGVIWSDSLEVATGTLAQWTTDNGQTIADFSGAVTEDFVGLAQTVGEVSEDIGTSMTDAWENEGSTAMSNWTTMCANVGGAFMNLYTQWVSPVVDGLKENLDSLWNGHLKPLWDNLQSFFYSLINFAATTYNNVIKPIIDIITVTLAPLVTWFVNMIWSSIETVAGIIADVVSGILRSLSGVLDFLTGVFSGDWDKAWQGIVDTFGGIFDTVWGVAKGVINLVIDGLNALWGGVYSVFAGIVNGAGGIVEAIGNAIGKDWGFSMPAQPPYIPKLAQGGLAHSATLAMIAEGTHDEAVLPLSAAVYQRIGAGISDNMDNSEQIALLREQNSLLRKLLDKDPVVAASITTQEIRDAFARENRKTGTTLVPVG